MVLLSECVELSGASCISDGSGSGQSSFLGLQFD